MHKIHNIEIDTVQEIEDFCTSEVLWKPKAEQLEAVHEFLEEHLRNAICPNVYIEKKIHDRIWDQESVKKLSQIFKDQQGYGVCLDWHAVAQVILEKLGIETIFRVGTVPGGPAHTYLDVKIDGWWKIFDPFAERYLYDTGQGGERFQSEYYKESSMYHN